MRDLAVFASSEAGRLYGASCDRWGVDPGGIFDDDVLAYNFRLGLAGAMAAEAAEADEPEETDADVARKHIDGMARAHHYGDMLRAAYG